MAGAAAYNFAQAGIAQLVEQLICNQKVAGSIPAVGTIDILQSICGARPRGAAGMNKIFWMFLLTLVAASALAQTSNAPLPLEVAQQRARFALEQKAAAERKFQAAEKKDNAAKKRLEEARAQAEQAAKELQDAQAEFAKARERHEQAHQELKRAHDALQGSNKPQ
jgi:hypothetical protein